MVELSSSKNQVSRKHLIGHRMPQIKHKIHNPQNWPRDIIYRCIHFTLYIHFNYIINFQGDPKVKFLQYFCKYMYGGYIPQPQISFTPFLQ